MGDSIFFKAAASRMAAVLLLLAFAPQLRAEVFSLWPFSQGGGGGTVGTGEVLNPKKLWTEPVVINGTDVSLGVALVETPIGDCMRQLKGAYPKASFAKNSSSILMESLANGKRMRLFLVSLGPSAPSLQFSMEIPQGERKVPDWIPEMPLPPASTPVTVMSFPNRGSAYGFFSSRLKPEEAVAEMRKNMAAAGWRRGSGDEALGDSTAGETFFRDNPLQIAIVGAAGLEDGSTRGSVYLRSIKPKP